MCCLGIQKHFTGRQLLLVKLLDELWYNLSDQLISLFLFQSAENGYTDLWSTAVAFYNKIPDLAHPILQHQVPVHDTTNTDVYSRGILTHFGMSNGIPLTVTADNNSLYNAASLALWGSEEKGVELRVRTCIHLVLNRSQYKRHLKANYKNVLSVTCPVREACLNVALYGEFASSWSFLALANITQRVVQSLYPPMNKQRDIMYQTMNTTFRPFNSNIKQSSQDLTILWTRCGNIDQQIWMPNHFVPVVSAVQNHHALSAIISSHCYETRTHNSESKSHHSRARTSHKEATTSVCLRKNGVYRSSVSRRDHKHAYRVVYHSKNRSTIVLRKVSKNRRQLLWDDFPISCDSRY